MRPFSHSVLIPCPAKTWSEIISAKPLEKIFHITWLKIIPHFGVTLQLSVDQLEEKLSAALTEVVISILFFTCIAWLWPQIIRAIPLSTQGSVFCQICALVAPGVDFSDPSNLHQFSNKDAVLSGVNASRLKTLFHQLRDLNWTTREGLWSKIGHGSYIMKPICI